MWCASVMSMRVELSLNSVKLFLIVSSVCACVDCVGCVNGVELEALCGCMCLCFVL